MTDRPSFEELAGGDDLSPEEAARLKRVHDLLVTAGPPPELPARLAEPTPTPQEDSRVAFLPRRRTGLALGLAAALALVAVVAGFVAGQRHGSSFPQAFQVPMHSTTGASTASAVIHVGKLDSAGNWPLKVDLQHLPQLPKGQYYEMFLSTKATPRAASCGTFRTAGDDEIRLNAPYNLKHFDGWVVTREGPGGKTHPVVLTT